MLAGVAFVGGGGGGDGTVVTFQYFQPENAQAACARPTISINL